MGNFSQQVELLFASQIGRNCTAREIIPSGVRNLRDPKDAEGGDGRRLYELLVAPASKLIGQETRIMVLPDPSLASLNFETLIVPGETLHFWIEDVTLTTASSLTLLAKVFSAYKTERRRQLLLLGNTEPVDAFPALAKAHEEMQRVRTVLSSKSGGSFGRETGDTGGFSTKQCGRYTYVHFVTHGIASVTRPLDSAVILSTDGDHTNLCTAILFIYRFKANLVTISACEGASGRAYSGEGLVGLSWAFLRAGAHNVVGALWEVNDSAAPQIMERFTGESAGARILRRPCERLS